MAHSTFEKVLHAAVRLGKIDAFHLRVVSNFVREESRDEKQDEIGDNRGYATREDDDPSGVYLRPVGRLIVRRR